MFHNDTFTINQSNENPKITDNISKKNKDPIKTKPENESNKNIVDGQVSFKNFDSTPKKVFLNGKEVKVDVFGSFKIPLLKENIIRVEEIDLANFVTLVKLSKKNLKLN